MEPFIFESEEPLPTSSLSRTRMPMPLNACDAHMHVFGDADRYPATSGARYTLPPAPVQQYDTTAAVLHLTRAVLVQPSYYGSDNACLLDRLDEQPSRRRGVVIANPRVLWSELAEWDARGVRGMRLDLFKARVEGKTFMEVERLVMSTCDRAARLGWSVDLYVPGATCWQIAPSLRHAACPVTIAHMGYLTQAEGITDQQCEAFISTIQDAPVWPKLSGAYRYGPGEGQVRAQTLMRGLLVAMTDRVLWGSDWPHVMAPAQDSGALLNQALASVDDPLAVQRILVSNPSRLYGFDA
jgi:predicted TIM-barrel fold metal-dependent hydrolase